VSPSEDGHDHVAGYHMSGEIIGTDGIGTDRYGSEAVALEDTEFCAMPFDRMETLSRQNLRFQHNLHRLLSREISRERAVMLLLGTMTAERRLAVFLLDLSQRYHARGYSSCEFVLRMTREEIGSYLGLKLETVSRLFSRFQRDGLLQVQGRVVSLLDRASLKQLIESPL
jgi:CRP/FNR family transcriptional regulator, anaerobic regulatory protein